MTENQTFTVYETTYALTEGIIKHEQARSVQYSTSMIEVPTNCGFPSTRYLHGEGNNWHLTYAAAREKAEAMRLKKIASLKKALRKMEALKFGASEPAQ